MPKACLYACLLLFSQSLIADPAIHEAVRALAPSTFSEAEMTKELAWFKQASQSFRGRQITVLSEDIPTHRWERDVLAPIFESITGINVKFDIEGEGTVVESIFKQLSQGIHLYDIYINDADHIGTHARSNSVVNLTEYMKTEGRRFTNPHLDLADL